MWSIYRDRAEAIDNDLLQGWNETLSTLLVFVRLLHGRLAHVAHFFRQAGLFSAVCTAFLLEVYVSPAPVVADEVANKI